MTTVLRVGSLKGDKGCCIQAYKQGDHPIREIFSGCFIQVSLAPLVYGTQSDVKRHTNCQTRFLGSSHHVFEFSR